MPRPITSPGQPVLAPPYSLMRRKKITVAMALTIAASP